MADVATKSSSDDQYSSSETAKNSNNRSPAEVGAGQSTSNSKGKTRKSQSEYSKLKRLNSRAEYVKKTIEENIAKGVSQTPANLESYDWAKKTITEFQAMCNERSNLLNTRAPPLGQSKRNRSLVTEEAETKKHKTSAPTPSTSKNLDRLPLSEIVKQNLKVCIVDLNEPNWRIPADRFVRIDNAIIADISKRIDTNGLTALPKYKMSERYFGFRIIACDSQLGLDLLKDIVENLGALWEGANIVLKPLADLPKPPKAKINIPGEPTKEDAMKILKISNPNLPMDTWTVMAYGPPQNNKTPIVFRINEGSVKILEEQENNMFFTLRELPVIISRTEHTSTSNADMVDNIIPQLQEKLTVPGDNESQPTV